MSLLAHKVLVQWLPSKALRLSRRLQLGLKYGSEVQQEAVKVTLHPDLFPLAACLATQRPDGTLHLQVGFRGETLFNGSGWVFGGHPSPAPHLPELHRFDTTPSLKKLLKQARKEHLAGGRIDLVKLDVRVEELARTVKAMLTDHASAVAAEVEAKPPSPFFNRDAFDGVAGWAPGAREEFEATGGVVKGASASEEPSGTQEEVIS